MAKSSRASVNKRNHQALKRKVFGPAEQARAERLSAKLQELVSQPKASEANAMEVEKEPEIEKSEEQNAEDALVGDDAAMDVDDAPKTSATKAKKTSRVQKKRRGKAQSTIVFPKFDKKRRSNKKGKK